MVHLSLFAIGYVQLPCFPLDRRQAVAPHAGAWIETQLA